MIDGPLLDRAQLREAFDLLATKPARRGVVGEVDVFGGAAMVLAFDARPTTRDVDAVFVSDGPMLEAAAAVAHELGLPRSWLNNQAAGYVSSRAARGTPVYDHPNLRVLITPPSHLLAMKVRAARATRDVDDIRMLLVALDISTMDAAVEVVGRYFPDEPLSDRSRLLLEDVLDDPP